MNQSSFNIFDASAGSGKTFTLVKEYLKILFSSSYDEAYRNILALTFTNKAVGEMKERIIDSLKQFSSNAILTNPNSMFQAICEELFATPEVIHEKAKTVLENIIHNYASFEVSTIDKFTQRVIRTFAHDLHLPLNFDVELDTDTLLAKAVDNLIARAGADKVLTNTLVDFALEKADEDKSWDISYDLNNIAPLLIKENDLEYIKLLENKNLSDFKTLKKNTTQQLTKIKHDLILEARRALALIDKHQIEHNSFSGRNGLLPSYFVKLSKEDFKVTFDKAWMEKIASHSLYPATTNPHIASVIDSIQPDLVTNFNNTKQLLIKYRFSQNLISNITPLSVLTEISKELKLLKEDQNLLLISEFNNIISNHIKQQPVPFIYERLGEKFKHYFIDEFQDTSILQWENLIPLIGNALSGENASALIVGDAKQAIYRWRGGKAEQFIDLYNEGNPFHIQKHIKRLPSNYRSARQVINFNNAFFRHIAAFAFTNSAYQNIYEKSSQEIFLDMEGHVNISFLEFLKDDDKDLLYAQQTYKTVKNCINNGYSPGDICILVRRKKEGIAIAEYLTQKGIDIVSSETLLIDNCPEVNFIIELLQYVSDPSNLLQKLNVLGFIGNDILGLNDIHEFYQSHVNESIEELFKSFQGLGFNIKLQDLTQNSLYEVVEIIIHGFALNKKSNAYIQFFLDFVLDYCARPNPNILDFLSHYSQKKDTFSIVAPENADAIKIMTIHKAKGLEFPVVIFPYADLDLYREKNPKIWFPLNQDEYNGFPFTYLNYNKSLVDISEKGASLYHQRQSELELDNINLLYVALTRPVEQLFIISNKRVDKKGTENRKYYSGLFISFLKQKGLWNDNTLEYCFGTDKKEFVSQIKDQSYVQQESFISSPKEHHNIQIVTNSGYLWNTKQQDAIEKGNLVHNIMAQIKTHLDVAIVLHDFKNSGLISEEQAIELKNIINNIVSHPDLSGMFDSKNVIYNEQEIITSDGNILRPDRLVINKHNEAVIIDYKTGSHHKTYEDQLNNYAFALEKMNLKIDKKILVYINDDLEIKEV